MLPLVDGLLQLYRLRSDVLDYMALGLPLSRMGDATISTARSTFYDLDAEERPRVFTWIDVGNEVEVLKLLQQDPSLAHSKFPEGGWSLFISLQKLAGSTSFACSFRTTG